MQKNEGMTQGNTSYCQESELTQNVRITTENSTPSLAVFITEVAVSAAGSFMVLRCSSDPKGCGVDGILGFPTMIGGAVATVADSNDFRPVKREQVLSETRRSIKKQPYAFEPSSGRVVTVIDAQGRRRERPLNEAGEALFELQADQSVDILLDGKAQRHLKPLKLQRPPGGATPQSDLHEADTGNSSKPQPDSDTENNSTEKLKQEEAQP